jgi:hypothetical protein
MLQSVLNALFWCGHQRTTFPITPGRRSAGSLPATPAASASSAATYVVCLDCGKQFAYDWRQMRVGDQMVATPPAADAQPLFR